MIDTHDGLPLASRRISWGSVFAGVAVALAAQIALGILGIGIGAGAVHPSNAASAGSLGIVSAIWLFLSTMIALFAGGWIAGRLAGIAVPLDRALHGVIAWALTTILAVYLVTTAVGGLFSGIGSLLGSVAGAAGTGIAAVAPSITGAAGAGLKSDGITGDSIAHDVRNVLATAPVHHVVAEAKNAATSTARDPQDARSHYNDLVYGVLHDTNVTSRSADRQKLIELVSQREGVSNAAASKTVDGWLDDARAAARNITGAAKSASAAAVRAGDAAANGVAAAGVTTFLFLLCGLGAAAFGGFRSVARNPGVLR